MKQPTDTDALKLCLRPACTDHAGDPTWLHPAPRPRRRPVYAAALRLSA